MSRSNLLTGIDIGTTKITTIIGQYFPDEDKMNIVGYSSCPSNGFRKGQVVNIEEAVESLTNSIDAAERMGGFTIREAAVSISSPEIQSTNSQGVVAVSSPQGEVSNSDVQRAIDASKAVALPQGREIIHVIPRYFVLDGQEGIIDPVGMSGTRLELNAHIITANSATVKNINKSLGEAGITLEPMVYAGLASAETVLTNTEKELGVAVIDIGGFSTSITLFSEGSPCFSHVIPVGAVNITNDLAVGFRLPIDQSEKIKLYLGKTKFGISLPDDEVEFKKIGIDGEDQRKLSVKTAIEGIIMPRLEEIAGLVYQTIKDSGYADSIPSGIVLTGGGSETVGIKDVFEHTIPLPVRTGKPPSYGGLADEIAQASHASSLGLLLFHKKEILAEDKGKRHKPIFDSVSKKLQGKGFFTKIVNTIKPLLP